MTAEEYEAAFDRPKHRREKEEYAVDFQNEKETNVDVAGGETLENESVEIWKYEDGAWVDVTSEFGPPDGLALTDDTLLSFTLYPADAADEQTPGAYVIVAEVDTSQGRHLVETPILEVVGDGGAGV